MQYGFQDEQHTSEYPKLC